MVYPLIKVRSVALIEAYFLVLQALGICIDDSHSKFLNKILTRLCYISNGTINKNLTKILNF